MAKIDCSTVVGFAHEASRLCEMYDDCGKCPFSGRKRCPKAVLEYDNPDVQSIIDELQAWSNEHPVKTRLDDLLEKYPKAWMEANSSVVAPWKLGYCRNCSKCSLNGRFLPDCWGEPVDGGATGEAVE